MTAASRAVSLDMCGVRRGRRGRGVRRASSLMTSLRSADDVRRERSCRLTARLARDAPVGRPTGLLREELLPFKLDLSEPVGGVSQCGLSQLDLSGVPGRV